MKLITREICLTGNIGVHGNLFGGEMLSWIDKAASIEATGLCGSNMMVTAEIESCRFLRKVKVNQQVNIYAKPVSIGRTSIVLEVEVRKYKVKTQEEELVCKTKIVFVRIDEEGAKVPISKENRESIVKIIEDGESDAKS